MSEERPAFIDQLKSKWDEGKFLCVGLDPVREKLPSTLVSRFVNDKTGEGWGNAFTEFCENIIDQTAGYVCAFKPNAAFFERLGQGEGEDALEDLVSYIHTNYSDIPVIGDVKRGDIGNTNLGYAEAAFDRFDYDAVTVSPFLGSDTFHSFQVKDSYKNRGLIALCRTTNPGSREFQDMPIWLPKAKDDGLVTREEYDELGKLIGRPHVRLYELIAFFAAQRWHKDVPNLALVVGATFPKDITPIRKLAGDLPFLVPGIGPAQGGEVEPVLQYAPDSNNQGMILSASSGVTFASSGDDYAKAAGEAAKKIYQKIIDHRAAA